MNILLVRHGLKILEGQAILIHTDIFFYEGPTFIKLGQQTQISMWSVGGSLTLIVATLLQQGHVILKITHSIT